MHIKGGANMGRLIRVKTEFFRDLKMLRFFVFFLLLSAVLIEIDACGFGSLGGCGGGGGCGSSCGGCGRKKREVDI